MKKFLNIDGWPKSATYLKNLYAKSEEPMPITPLYLHNHSISNPILLHVLMHITTEQHKQIQAGNKYKISKNGMLPTSISYNYPIMLTVLSSSLQGAPHCLPERC
jgi:hypothetical protein